VIFNNIIYNNSDEKTTAKTTIDLDTEIIYYFWYRMISILQFNYVTL